METTGALPLSVTLVVVFIAAGTDLWKFRIHNGLTIPFLLSGLMYHALAGQGIGLSGSVWGMLAGTLPFAWLYMKGGMGAGDLKLMAGVGAWLGPWFALHVLIGSGLATGCYTVGLMILDRLRTAPERDTARSGSADPDSRQVPDDVCDVLNRPGRRSKAIPFGAMVALGIVFTTFWIG